MNQMMGNMNMNQIGIGMGIGMNNQLMMTNFVMDDTASRMKNIITSYEEKINELQKLIDEKESIIRQKESE